MFFITWIHWLTNLHISSYLLGITVKELWIPLTFFWLLHSSDGFVLIVCKLEKMIPVRQGYFIMFINFLSAFFYNSWKHPIIFGYLFHVFEFLWLVDITPHKSDCMFLSYHVRMNVKELLARNRCNIWSLSDCNGTWTHNHLVRNRTLNHLAKLTKSLCNRFF